MKRTLTNSIILLRTIISVFLHKNVIMDCQFGRVIAHTTAKQEVLRFEFRVEQLTVWVVLVRIFFIITIVRHIKLTKYYDLLSYINGENFY